MHELVERLLKGEKRAAARLVTLVDDKDPRAGQLMKEILFHSQVCTQTPVRKILIP